jgi:hypothetical protein
MAVPAFRSLVFDDVPAPDFADVCVIPLPPGAPTDPKVWAERIFSGEGIPGWVKAAMGLRQLLVPVLGIPKAPRGVFAVRKVVGDEALLAFDDRHLDFRVGVGVDTTTALVRVVTAVRLKGWRGRLYFGPVRLLHPSVVQAMMRRAARSLAGRKP